jgi:hypothetical protein
LNRLFIVDIANDKDALTVANDRMGSRLNGTADVLLKDIEGGTFPDPLDGIVVLIQIKKAIQKSDQNQAFGHVAASIKHHLAVLPLVYSLSSGSFHGQVKSL